MRAASRLPAAARAAFLDRIGTEIESHDDLIETAHVETALPTQRLAGARARTANQLRMFATLVREGSWVVVPAAIAKPTFGVFGSGCWSRTVPLHSSTL